MPDSISITPGVGAAVATELNGGFNYQIIKQAFGATGTVTLVSPATPYPVQPGLKLTEQCTRFAISVAANGDNALIAGVASQFVRVYALLLICKTPVDVTLHDTTPTNLTGAMTFGAGGGIFLGQQGEPHFITAIGKGLSLTLSAAVQVSGVLWYTQGV